jgi:hypothetical protein
MARFHGLTVDSLHPARLARFWAAALGGYAVRPHTAADITQLAARGLTPETDTSVMVDGRGPSLCFQIKHDRAAIRGRLHLDVTATDRAGEVARLTALGATVREITKEWTVMLDPEGNAFCVIDQDSVFIASQT